MLEKLGPEAREFTISSRGGFIGTNPSCEIVLDDRSVSRFNTEVVFSKDTFLLSDKKSSNGTFLRMDHSFGEIRLVSKMSFEFDDFTVQVKDPAQCPMKIKVLDMLKGEGHEELIDFGAKARFCYSGRDGYKIQGSNEARFEAEFIRTKGVAYLQIAPEPSIP